VKKPKTKQGVNVKEDKEVQTDLFDVRFDAVMKHHRKEETPLDAYNERNMNSNMLNPEQKDPRLKISESTTKKVKRISADDKNTIESWSMNRTEVNAEMLSRYPHLIEMGYML